MHPSPPSQDAIKHTQTWLERIVIGLSLCPFARQPYLNDTIRFVETPARTEEALVADLLQELTLLQQTPIDEIETTLLIHPHVLDDFLDYNDFLDVADACIEELGLEGVIQVAGFHPMYQFAGTRVDDIENETNRSPYPMMHLIREESITRVRDAGASTEDIPQRNIALLQEMGRAAFSRLMEE